MSASQYNATGLASKVTSASVDQYGSTNGSAYVAMGLPLNAAISSRYTVAVARTLTAVAPVAALPTTAAHFLLWNGEPQTTGNGYSYVILEVGWTTIASAAAAFVGQLIVHNAVGAVSAIPSVTAALGPKCLNGTTYGGTAMVGSAGTIVNSGIWHPVGPSFGGAQTATISSGNTTALSDYIVPPGGIFSLAVFCSAAGSATCDVHVKWAEIPL